VGVFLLKMEKNICFLFLLLIISCSPISKKINIIETEIILNARDSILLTVENIDNKNTELKSKNSLIASVKENNQINGILIGKTCVYAVNKDNPDDIDSCKIIVKTDKISPYQEPLFNANTTISDVLTYEKENGFEPVVKKHLLKNSKNKTNYLSVNRSYHGATNKDMIYSFNNDDKLMAVFLPLNAYNFNAESDYDYFFRIALPATFVGYKNIVFLLYDNETDDEFMKKIELMGKGAYSHPKLKDSICLTLLLSDELSIIAYHRAQDVNIFPKYLSSSMFSHWLN
jgi:hypothetical protein